MAMTRNVIHATAHECKSNGCFQLFIKDLLFRCLVPLLFLVLRMRTKETDRTDRQRNQQGSSLTVCLTDTEGLTGR